MERVETDATEALAKTGHGYAYPVVPAGEDQVHLTIGVGETLCNIRVGRGSTRRAAFDDNGCPTCWRVAEARDLRIAGSGRPGLTVGA